MDVAETAELASLVLKLAGVAENAPGTVDACQVAKDLIGPECLHYVENGPPELRGDLLILPLGDPDLNVTVARLVAAWALRELADWHDDAATTAEVASAVADAILDAREANKGLVCTSEIRLQTAQPHKRVS